MKEDETNRIYQERIIELKADTEYKRQMAEADKKDAEAKKEEADKKKEQKKKLQQAMQSISDPLYVVGNFIEQNPIYYDNNLIWWMWNEDLNKWEITDETNILNSLNEAFDISGITSSKTKTSFMNALKMVARKNKPIDLGKEWLQFKNTLVNLKTGEEQLPDSKYFLLNPCPWNLGTRTETPIMDKLFVEWVGEGYKKTLAQIASYCLYRDYPIHIIVALIGKGRNGKSKYLDLIKKFVGRDNITATKLQTLLTRTFESAKLYKKLVCTISETDNKTISQSSILKELSGQDLIGYEFKNKNPFDDVNYAKILMATNSLPGTNDDTDGFYRRWLIIDFPNQFPEGKNILDTIPEEEYECLARQSVNLLKELLDDGMFANQGTIPERKQRYEERSDPLESFLNDECDLSDPDAELLSVDFTSKFYDWLKEKGFRKISDRHLGIQLKNKNIEKEMISKDFKRRQYVLGVKWKSAAPLAPHNTTTLNSPLSREQVNISGASGASGADAEIQTEIENLDEK